MLFVLVDATQQTELLVVEHQAGLDGVGVVLLHQIHHFRTDIADGRTFVGHLLHSHIRGHGDALVHILHDVIVAVQLTSDLRQVGDHGGQFSQIQLVDADGEVLQHRRVLILRIELETRLVVGDQVHLRLNLLTLGEEDEIVLVQVELLVADGGTVRHQFQTDTVFFHLRCRTDAHTKPVLIVEIAQTSQGSVLVEVTVEEGIEHELRVLLVVAHLSLITEPLASLREVQADGVDARAVVVERVEMALTVDTCLWRGGHVEQQFLEVDVLQFQQVGDGVLALALHVEFHRGQEPFHGWLVDDILIVLRHDGVGEGRQLVKHQFVAAAGIHLHDEVATLRPHVGGVRIGLQQDAHLVRMVVVLAVVDIEIRQQSADVVRLVQV